MKETTKIQKTLRVLELGHRHCDHNYCGRFTDDLFGVQKHERNF